MRALLVEDHVTLAQGIGEALRTQGLVVDVAHDGARGFDLAVAFPYDVIVLDRMLPALDGDGLCRGLRARGDHTPILMLTARDTVADRIEGLDAGADDYLVKPFATGEFQARVRALLRRKAPGAGRILEAGDLTVDVESGDVTRSGVRVELGRKEFAILTYLLRHRGRIVPKEELLDHLWGEADDPCVEDTLRSHVRNLRRKVDDGLGKPLIRTVYGRGYGID